MTLDYYCLAHRVTHRRMKEEPRGICRKGVTIFFLGS